MCNCQVKEGVKWYRNESIRTRVYSSPVLHEDEPQPPRPDKALWKQVTVSVVGLLLLVTTTPVVYCC